MRGRYFPPVRAELVEAGARPSKKPFRLSLSKPARYPKPFRLSLSKPGWAVETACLS